MKLYLIDGYGFVFRAYHSMPPLTRPDGLPIGAVYGFTNMLYKFLSSHDADMIAVVLDSGRKNFRHEIYDAYKANRPEPPEELVVQFPIIREVVEAFNVRALDKVGYEADDLIATYARIAREQGIDVKIISSDKDLMQLVDDKVKMYDAMKDRDISYEEVDQKFGVRPDQVLDLLSLIGDSSDNVPGVKGIGLKTAAELINQFDSLDGIYANLEKIQQARRKQLLEEGKDLAYLSRRLITLDSNVDVDVSLEKLKVQEFDKEKLVHFLEEQGFRSLVAKVAKGMDIPSVKAKSPEIKTNELKDIASLNKLVPNMLKQQDIAFVFGDTSIEFSFDNSLYSIEYKKEEVQESLFTDMDSNNKLNLKNILNVLSEVFADESVRIIVVDAKRILKLLREYDLKLTSYDDVAVMSYALDTGKHKYSINDLVKVYQGDESECNASALIKVFYIIQNHLFQNKILSLYERLEKKMIGILFSMETKGVKLDLKFLKSLSEEFSKKISDISGKIYRLAGREVNIASPKQLSELLFGELGMKMPEKVRSKKNSTGAEVLEALKEQGHDIAGLILEWRQYTKLLNTYIDALPKHVNTKTGRVHTNFIMTATTTGRLSSTDPNLQNIPIRTDEGHKIREAFIVEKGNQLISADYSQIELRLLAHIADIKQLKDAFLHGQDIHATTASEIFGVPINEVDSNLRRQAKTINFGIIYGISPFGLATRLNIPNDVAKKYIERYFQQYPGIKEYMQSAIDYARKHGYVKTLMGRRCYVEGINDKNFALRGLAERAAINAPLQGTAADIIKKAMIDLPAHVSKHLILQIHDELLFEVQQSEVEKVKGIIKKVMENVINISVPMSVDVKSGENWALAH